MKNGPGRNGFRQARCKMHQKLEHRSCCIGSPRGKLHCVSLQHTCWLVLLFNNNFVVPSKSPLPPRHRRRRRPPSVPHYSAVLKRCRKPFARNGVPVEGKPRQSARKTARNSRGTDHDAHCEWKPPRTSPRTPSTRRHPSQSTPASLLDTP